MNNTENLTPTGETLVYMERLSKFAYYNELNFKLSQTSRILSNDEIEKAVLLGEIVPGDYFVLKAVAEFSWANCEMITRALARMHRTEPGKAYPEPKMEITKSRLVKLSKSSLVKGFEYMTADGKAIKVYCATDAGIYLLKKKLYYDGNIETFNCLQPPEEAFRRLATNYVAQRMSYGGHNIDFIPGRWEYIQSVGKVFLYSQLFYKVDGSEHVVLVEPYYLKSNENIVAKKEMNAWITNRITLIKKYKALHEVSKKFSLVYVVEDKEGLKEAVNFAVNEFPDDLANIYFTSENAIFMTKKKFSYAFLKIENVINGVPSIKASVNLEYM